MRAPAIFVSHGAPTVALADDDYTAALRALSRDGPRPAAIAIVSAHWQTAVPLATGAKQPESIHDFGGFPDELYAIRYECAGSPVLARRIADLLGGDVDRERGIDHGAWVPLRHMFPYADVPVVQVSLPARAPPEKVIELGRRLASLRDEAVWLVGSGGVVHNLARLLPEGSPPAEWARAFDAWVWEGVTALDLTRL